MELNLPSQRHYYREDNPFPFLAYHCYYRRWLPDA